MALCADGQFRDTVAQPTSTLMVLDWKVVIDVRAIDDEIMLQAAA